MTPLTIGRERASERAACPNKRTDERTNDKRTGTRGKAGLSGCRVQRERVLKRATRAIHRERVLVLGLVPRRCFINETVKLDPGESPRAKRRAGAEINTDIEPSARKRRAR